MGRRRVHPGRHTKCRELRRSHRRHGHHAVALHQSEPRRGRVHGWRRHRPGDPVLDRAAGERTRCRRWVHHHNRTDAQFRGKGPAGHHGGHEPTVFGMAVERRFSVGPADARPGGTHDGRDNQRPPRRGHHLGAGLRRGHGGEDRGQRRDGRVPAGAHARVDHRRGMHQ